MEAILSGEQILSLIPQRPPIVMVDKFYGIEDNISFCGITIDNTNLFFIDNHLSEAGIIEHIAQSAAARVGYICLEQNSPIPLG